MIFPKVKKYSIIVEEKEEHCPNNCEQNKTTLAWIQIEDKGRG